MELIDYIKRTNIEEKSVKSITPEDKKVLHEIESSTEDYINNKLKSDIIQCYSIIDKLDVKNIIIRCNDFINDNNLKPTTLVDINDIDHIKNTMNRNSQGYITCTGLLAEVNVVTSTYDRSLEKARNLIKSVMNTSKQWRITGVDHMIIPKDIYDEHEQLLNIREVLNAKKAAYDMGYKLASRNLGNKPYEPNSLDF